VRGADLEWTWQACSAAFFVGLCSLHGTAPYTWQAANGIALGLTAVQR
jgi:hypothetical protein